MNAVVCCSYEWFDLLFVCWFVVSGCIAYVLIVLVWLLFLFMWLWLRVICLGGVDCCLFYGCNAGW